MDFLGPHRDGVDLHRPRQVKLSRLSHNVIKLLTEIHVAIIRQLAGCGISLASIALSWCILQEHTFQPRQLRLVVVRFVWVAIIVVQIIIIAVPVGIVGRAEDYYSPNE